MGASARLRTDDALVKAMDTSHHTATSLAAQVTAYGYPVSRQMITKLMNPTEKWGLRHCSPSLAIYTAQAVRMPVEFIFDMPEPKKTSSPRRSMTSTRKKGAHTAQERKPRQGKQ